MTTTRILFRGTHSNEFTHVGLLDLYSKLCDQCQLGKVTHVWLRELPGNDLVPGDAEMLRERLTANPQRFAIRAATGVEFHFVLQATTPPTWLVSTMGMELDGKTLRAMTELCLALYRSPVPPLSLVLARDERDVTFVPKPPIAEHRHVVSTSHQEVNAAYDDASVFWRSWSEVVEAGDQVLCIRAPDAGDLQDYLARTFEDNVALAHHSLAGLTKYGLPDARLRQKLEKEYGPWWVLGPRDDEKAGMPALTFIGRDPSTGTFHYTGLIEREGKEERGRVQVRELYELDRLRYDEDGEPVPGRVHVLFLDDWMARQERRPLLDVGARVFFYASDGTKVEVTD